MKNKFNIGDRVVAKDFNFDFVVSKIEINELGVFYRTNLNDLISESQLEKYTKTETYYQYIYKSKGKIWNSGRFYKNDEQFKAEHYEEATWFQKLPTPFEVPCE